MTLKTSNKKEAYDKNNIKILEPYNQTKEELELNNIINSIISKNNPLFKNNY